MFAVIGFLVIKAVISIGPVYMENRLLQQVLADLQSEVNQKGMDTREGLEILRKKLLINNIRHLDTRRMPITREDDKVTLTVEYEQRRNYLGNADIVVHFGPYQVDFPAQ